MSRATANSVYADAIASLNALIPELFTAPAPSNAGPGTAPARRKFSLDEIGTLAAALGDPHRQFPAVLIAGTNGKGSTASTLASIARAAGVRTGLYTSPHLERVNERIRLNGETISDDDFARLYFRVHDTAQELVQAGRLAHLPSYFELLTALAFLYFAESRVELAILEVGMGGRLDATNLVDPILSVITDISLDHQEWLGDTIDLIAREKAGILRPNGILVTLPQHPEANQAIGEVATQLDVRGVNAALYTPPIHTGPAQPYQLEVLGQIITIDSPLHGAHQHRNLALAIATAVELAENHRFPITAAAIAEGIHATRWPGRLETIQIPGQSAWILDVAHNPAGAWALRAALNTSEIETGEGAPHLASEMWDSPRQFLIFACLRDKPLQEMTQILFPIFDHVVVAPMHTPRATPVADLVAAAESLGAPCTAASSVEEALQIARSLHPARIVVSGSLFLVGEARTLLLQQRERLP
jgi:dihydrofolate synthase / folylpolyglutamate synthase